MPKCKIQTTSSVVCFCTVRATCLLETLASLLGIWGWDAPAHHVFLLVVRSGLTKQVAQCMVQTGSSVLGKASWPRFSLPDRTAREENCRSPTELQGGMGLSSLSSSRVVRARGGQTSLLLHVRPPEGLGVQEGVLLSHASVLWMVLGHAGHML